MGDKENVCAGGGGFCIKSGSNKRPRTVAPALGNRSENKSLGSDPSGKQCCVADDEGSRGGGDWSSSGKVVSTCSICFDPLDSEGDHMLACLACGHLFGERCIRRWIKRSKFCPQCHAVAKPRDVRTLYVPDVISVRETRAERRLARQLDAASAEKADAERRAASLALEHANLKSALDDAVNALRELDEERRARREAEQRVKELSRRLAALSTSFAQMFET